MKVALSTYKDGKFTTHPNSDQPGNDSVHLVLGFGNRQLLETENLHAKLHHRYPNAQIALWSTAGEIHMESVMDNTVSVTALQMEKTSVQTASVNIRETRGDSREAGKLLAKKLGRGDDMVYVMILSDGSMVNGSQLIRGLHESLGKDVPVTGGLAGDGADFTTTLVGLNEEPVRGTIVTIAFHGKHLRVGHGSMGGWEMFGLERTVTKSQDNVLFEVDDKPVLDLYKNYLGPYAAELPGSALLFPLSVRLSPESEETVVRTILSIDEAANGMVFAGDVPEGAKVRFMKANFDRLIDAASDAAQQTFRDELGNNPRLAILISCVGRKIILANRIEEEVEAVRDVFGERTLLTGFYSYGEISPMSASAKCELHNQTMTITTLDEY